MPTEKKAVLSSTKLVTISQGLNNGSVTVYLVEPDDPSGPEDIRFTMTGDDKFARTVANADLAPLFGGGATPLDSNALIKLLATTQVVPRIVTDTKHYVMLKWSYGRNGYFEVRVPWIGDPDEGDPEPEDEALAEQLVKSQIVPKTMVANKAAPAKTSVAPAKPSIAPVKPSVVPAKQSVAPTKPSVAPVKPSVAPTKPPVAPVKPSAAPVKPSVDPAKKSLTLQLK